MKKRILVISLTIGENGERDGAVIFYNELIRYLRKEKIKADVLTYGKKNEIRKKGTVRIYIQKPVIKIKLDESGFTDLIPSKGEIVKEVMNNEYSSVLVGTPEMLGTIAMKIAKKQNIPLTAFFHTVIDEYVKLRAEKVGRKIIPGNHKIKKRISKGMGRIAKKIVRARFKKFYNQASQIIVPTEGIKQKIKSYIKKPIKVVLHGVDTKKFYPTKNKKNDITKCIYVGRIVPEKNVQILKKIFKNKKAELTMIGEGILQKEMKKSLPKAKLTGVLQHKEVAKKIRESDIFIFPSKTDTFGLVVLEAMSCKVPPIIMDAQGPKEFVKHLKTGYIAKNNKDFEKGIDKLIKNKKLREKIGENARKFAIKNSWHNSMKELIKKVTSDNLKKL